MRRRRCLLVPGGGLEAAGCIHAAGGIERRAEIDCLARAGLHGVDLGGEGAAHVFRHLIAAGGAPLVPGVLDLAHHLLGRFAIVGEHSLAIAQRALERIDAGVDRQDKGLVGHAGMLQKKKPAEAGL